MNASLATETPVPPNTTVKQHPVEAALFNTTGPITLVWLAIRLWLGFQWAQAGWEKINNAEWMSGAKIAGYWQNSLADYGKPNADVAYDWYAGFLKGLQDSNAQTWFAPLIAWGELLGGIALMVGLFTGIVALLLAFMNFNYMLAGSAGVNPVYLVLAILIIVAWKNAGWWGLDRFVLPAVTPRAQQIAPTQTVAATTIPPNQQVNPAPRNTRP